MSTLIGTSDLSDASIRKALLGLMRRAVIAGPFHVFGFTFGIFLIPGLEEQSFAWIVWTVLAAAALLRYIQFRFTRKLLDKPDTIWIWRCIFAVHTLMLGGAWGCLSALCIVHFGLNSSMITILAMTSAVCAVAIPAFSFDLLIQLAFQVCMFLPAIIVAWKMPDPNGHMIGIGYSCFMVFMWYAGGSLFRFHHGILAASEVVEKQKLEIEKANQMVSTMLENIDEAFLNLGTDCISIHAVSEKSKLILGIDPSGLTLGEIFSDDPKVQRETNSWLNLLFKQPGLFDTLAELAPKIMIRRSDGNSIRLEYHPIRKGEDELTAVVVTGIDVTRELTAKKQATLAHDRAELILRISENRAGFQGLLNQTGDVIEKMRSSPERTEEIRHALHTLKGGMSIFGAMDFALVLHRCELSLREANTEQSLQAMQTQTEVLAFKYAAWRKANLDLFAQLGVFSDQLVELSKRKLVAVQSEFAADPVQKDVVDRLILKLTALDFGDMFEDFRHYVEDASQRLGKKVSFLVQRPKEPVLVDAKSRETLRSFIHFFNNAIDHGIESPKLRTARGKNESGQIKVSYEDQKIDNKDWIRIFVEDDGGGIDIAAIREKCRGDLSAANLTDLQIAEKIFDNEFSTRTVVTETSGQGVGMASLRATILKSGGKIRIAETSPQGTRFEVILPV